MANHKTDWTLSHLHYSDTFYNGDFMDSLAVK